jgi:hypothetical protein
MAEHTITVVELRPADPYGYPGVAAHCSCGWRGILRAGRRGAESAAADGAAHLHAAQD